MKATVMRKTFRIEDVKVLITHVIPGYSHHEVHGYAWDASNEDIEQTAAIEVFGWPTAPLGTRELTRTQDNKFSIIVHTN